MVPREKAPAGMDTKAARRARRVMVVLAVGDRLRTFSQLTGDASGTGLGLAISRQVVEAMLWRRRPSWRNW